MNYTLIEDAYTNNPRLQTNIIRMRTRHQQRFDVLVKEFLAWTPVGRAWSGARLWRAPGGTMTNLAAAKALEDHGLDWYGYVVQRFTLADIKHRRAAA